MLAEQAGAINNERLAKLPIDVLLKIPDFLVEQGGTALHWAAENGLANIVQLLIEKGIYVDSRYTRSRLTALHLAVLSGHKKIVGLLIEKGANVKAADKNGKTALELAAEKGYEKINHVLVYKIPDSLWTQLEAFFDEFLKNKYIL